MAAARTDDVEVQVIIGPVPGCSGFRVNSKPKAPRSCGFRAFWVFLGSGAVGPSGLVARHRYDRGYCSNNGSTNTWDYHFHGFHDENGHDDDDDA